MDFLLWLIFVLAVFLWLSLGSALWEHAANKIKARLKS